MKTIKTDSIRHWITANGGQLLHTFTTTFSINGMGISRDIWRLTDGRIAVDEAPFTTPRKLTVGTVEQFRDRFGSAYDSELAAPLAA